MILLTGVSGFIGKHLLKALVKEYGKENILALTSKPITECAYLLHLNYTFDKDYFVASGYETIQTIIHVGAFTPKSGNEGNNWQACNTNIIYTHQLLSANLPYLDKVIYLSTLDVYEAALTVTEETSTNPISLYGASKLYVEKMIAAWGALYGRKCQVLRVGHVYGPGEEAYQKLIPNTMRCLLNDKTIQIFGSGEEIRSFIYIDDVVEAILNSLKLRKDEGVINLVGAQQITVKKLIQKLIAISGHEAKVEKIKTDVQSRDLIFDNSKMKNILLSEETSLDIGLEIEWEHMRKEIK